MLNLALWLKANNFRPDQVQTFTPTPLAMATAMYYSRKNPLRRVSQESEDVETPRLARQRKLHKALLRYHDPENFELIREFLTETGRRDLIGNGPQHLVPWTSSLRQPQAATPASPRRKPVPSTTARPGTARPGSTRKKPAR
jgi:hypothetical protein